MSLFTKLEQALGFATDQLNRLGRTVSGMTDKMEAAQQDDHREPVNTPCEVHKHAPSGTPVPHRAKKTQLGPTARKS